MSRRKSRVIAVQALYSWDVTGETVESLLQFNWVDSRDSIDQASLDFSRIIVSGTIENINAIDENIKTHLAKNWNFDRLNKVALAILRISVYSILFQKDITASIVIDEAIDLSKDFGLDDSFKFINAVLDKISKEKKEK